MTTNGWTTMVAYADLVATFDELLNECECAARWETTLARLADELNYSEWEALACQC